MTLTQIHYYTSVIEHGSLSAAAARLHVSVSTVSQSIKELEKELDVVLLTRTSRGIIPTPAGKIFLERSAAVLKSEEDLMNTMREIASRAVTVTLGIPTITCDTIWPVLSRYIYQRCPGITVNIITTATNAELLRMLDEQKIDAIIAIHPPEKYQSYNILVLWPAPKLALIVSEKNWLAKKPSVTFEQVMDLPLVRHISDNKAAYLGPIYAQYGKTPRFIETCEQLSTMMGIVRNNVAATYLNTEIAKHYGGVKALFIPEQDSLNFYLIWSQRVKPSKSFLTFLGIINNLLLELDDLWEDA